MRIRKHAKISPLVYATSSLKPGTVLQTHVCQLNQSPWDVMKFSPPSTPPRPTPSPPPPQVDENGAPALNGSLSDRISVVESENVWDYNDGDQQREYSDDIPAAEEQSLAPPVTPAVEETEVVLCCKTDGKSWQCRREAMRGNSLCDHHYSQVKSYNHNSSSHYAAAKKLDKLNGEARRRARAKKALTSSTSNPYEFYYYSGFGPRWGKKRGETCKNSNADSITMKRKFEHEDEIEHPREYDEYEYEEEYDEQENRDNIIGKKRVRKPIKARSLKSLM